MSYQINGIELNNKTLGWTLERGSVLASALSFEGSSFSLPGRDGSIVFPTVRKPSTISFQMKSGLATRADLLALFTQPVLEITNDDRPGLVAEGYLLTSSVDAFHDQPQWARDTFIVEIPDGAWRTQATQTYDSVPGPSELEVFPGLSAPVQDALLRVYITPESDVIQGFRVSDSGGSFIRYTTIFVPGDIFYYDSLTRRAWIGEVDDGPDYSNEVTGWIDYGGRRGFFEIQPQLSNPTDPTSRVGSLTWEPVLYDDDDVVDMSLSVRGRNLYLI